MSYACFSHMGRVRHVRRPADEGAFCDAGTCRYFDRCRQEADGVCLAKDRNDALAEDAAEGRRSERELGL